MRRVRQKSSRVSSRPPSAATRRSTGSAASRVSRSAASCRHLCHGGFVTDGRLGGRDVLDLVVDGGVDCRMEVGDRGKQVAVGTPVGRGAVEVGDGGTGRTHEMGGERADRHAFEGGGLVPSLGCGGRGDEFGCLADGFDNQSPHAGRIGRQVGGSRHGLISIRFMDGPLALGSPQVSGGGDRWGAGGAGRHRRNSPGRSCLHSWCGTGRAAGARAPASRPPARIPTAREPSSR